MEDLAKLQNSYLLHRLGVGDLSDGIEWAMERLRLDQEGNDLEIVLLAGAVTTEEALPYAEIVLTRYCGQSVLNDQLAAGKYIVELRHKYLAQTETVDSLDAKLTQLYNRLSYPSWMAMLARNCEYATDIPAFHQPFEQEFQYIAELWAKARSREEFEGMYSRAISNQHDVK